MNKGGESMNNDNHDFSNLGEQIQDMVQDAMDSMNFSHLNQSINETVSQALDEAKEHKARMQRHYEKNRAKQQYRTPNYQSAYQTDYQPNYKANYVNAEYKKPVSLKKQMKQIVNPKTKKSTGKIVWGALLTWGTMHTCLEVLDDYWEIVHSDGMFAAAGSLGISILLLVGSVWLLIKGIRQRMAYQNAKAYVEILNGRGFCEISELSSRTGQSVQQVRKNIRKLIQKRVFREAYLDKQETCLMVNRTAYQYYRQAEAARVEREAEEAKKRQVEGELPPDVVEMIHTGEQYIQNIRQANHDISGEVISAKLDRLELVVQRIFDSVKKHPEQKKEMSRFMDYYMPTTLKLVNTYREFDALEVKGENIKNAMTEIEHTLDTITTAFEKLLDDLFQDTAFDVSTDISVLQTMLAQEGYKEEDFNIEDKK